MGGRAENRYFRTNICWLCEKKLDLNSIRVEHGRNLTGKDR